jgi:hypothetical protein
MRLWHALVIAATAGGAAAFNQPAEAAEQTGTGTGFLISKEGWVITNAHVVEGCSYVEVSSFGKVTDIQLDKQNDLAVLRFKPSPSTSEPLKLRKTPPRLGEDVAALGYPLSQILSDGIKITMGNINSLIGLENDTRYLQISTPIQPGNSGGPLVDKSSYLVGINSARLNDDYAIKRSGSIPQNVNFAIKSSILELFLQSRNITYTKDENTDNIPLSSADLAEKVSKSVFQIACYADSPVKTSEAPSFETRRQVEAPAPVAPKHNTDTMDETIVELVTLMINSNNNATTALRIADKLYSSHVDFFGKPLTHRQVMQDKRKYFDRWPIRKSYVHENTIRVLCEDETCAVTGEYDWYVRSPKRNKEASGTASFYYVVDVQNGKIIAEGGKARK